VSITRRSHLNDFPIDEFNALLLSKEPGFRHFNNVVSREKFSGGFHAHIFFSFHIANQFFLREATTPGSARWRPLLMRSRM